MENVWQIEKETFKRTEQICEIIVNELSNYCEVPESSNSYTNTVIGLLLTNFKGKSILISLLNKYLVNERALLLFLTLNFSRPFIEPFVKRKMIREFSKLPYHRGFTVRKSHYTIATTYGTLELFELRNWLKSHKIKSILEYESFANECHLAAEILIPTFWNENITTSEFTSLFGGVIYHSYFTLSNGEGVIDPACNAFYPGTCFQKIFKPNVICEYPASEFHKKYSECQKQCDFESSLYPVLEIARCEKRKIKLIERRNDN